MKRLTAIILTHNEEVHIERCVASLANVVDHILVCDSYSSDRTVELAELLGCEVITNKWVNYAEQFSYAHSFIRDRTEWILRIDADEYLTMTLAENINTHLASVDDLTSGLVMSRRMSFMGKIIRHGGVFPVQVLRIFRSRDGRIEKRWMDEHILLDRGRLGKLRGELIDDNKNSLGWWLEKHNKYASREAIDILVTKHAIGSIESVSDGRNFSQAKWKRILKERAYNKLPIGMRAVSYFGYRYFLRLGFLDGVRGFFFHFFQGLMYRMLVDAKVYEIEEQVRTSGKTMSEAIEACVGVEIKV